MLQFVIKSTRQASVAELAHMAMEGGCRWIQISDQAAGEREPRTKALSEELIPDYEAHETFLIIENNVDLVEELKVHGVFLRDCNRSTVLAARERLGAEAVIGVQARDIDEIAALHGLDVDYVMVPVPEGLDPEGIRGFYDTIIRQAAERAVVFHIVAEGDFTPDNICIPLEAGCAGVAVSSTIADSANPTLTTTALLEQLEALRQK